MVADRRRTFVPVVLTGLAAGVLCAVAGNRPWAVGGGRGVSGDGADWYLGAITSEYPLAGSLSLVLLACWGVLLVTRGRVRRVVAVVGLLAALGMLATVVVGFGGAPEFVRDGLADVGVTGQTVSRTRWYWVAVVAALVSVAATALAVRWAPAWPVMGSRYDAPNGGGHPAPAEDVSELELWKAMDEGRDPTA